MRWIAIIFITVFVGGMFSCANMKKVDKSNYGESKVQLEAESSDSTEYDLIITDPGFESWFVTNRKPEWYHSQEFLENKNWQYVSAWNYKVTSSNFQSRSQVNPFIEEIDYRPGVDYGLDLNYKLYYYFKFIEDTWGKIL